MASETPEEKKQEEEIPVEEKEQAKPEHEGEGKEEVKEEEVKEEVLAGENEEAGKEEQEEDAKEEAKSEEVVMEEEKEQEEEVEGSKKGKRSVRKRGRQDSAEKEKEPVTPSSERPTRERKMVERYSVPDPGRSASKPLSIEKGPGTQLKDIPNVAFKLSKRKPDDNMQMLHAILFGKKAKAHNLKKNIGQFSGYVWVENEQEKHKAKVREKLDKCVKEKLMDFCDVLNIPINKAVVKKEELTVKILDFLESPHATTEVLLADKEQKGKRRRTTLGKNLSPGEASVTPVKKQKQTPQTGEKQKHPSEDEDDEDENNIESPDAKGDSRGDDEDVVPKEDSDQEENNSKEEEEEEEEEEDEPKMPGKKASSRKAVKQNSGAKGKDKSTPVKITSAKPVKSPAKSTKKSSGSSKRSAADADGASGSASKSKGSASKRQKIEKENSKDRTISSRKVTSKKQSSKVQSKASAKDQGKVKSGKKAKAEPSREEMHTVVVDILKEVDFNTATLSDILRQLGTHFGLDLMHRKAEVKDIITDVINSMSDEEDEEEAEENVDAGGDADRDGDEDDA